jgi:hypothetical protein
MSLDQKQWLVDFVNAALHLIYQLPVTETWRADHFSAQLCPKHGSNCIRIVLADIVLEHFDYTRYPPPTAAQVLLPANRRPPAVKAVGIPLNEPTGVENTCTADWGTTQDQPRLRKKAPANATTATALGRCGGADRLESVCIAVLPPS